VSGRFLRSKTISVLLRRSTTCRAFTAPSGRFPTDVILLEWNLIAGSINTVAELVGRVPELKIIVHSSANDESNAVELFRSGVRGIIPGSISPDMLVKCVRKIAAGRFGSTTDPSIG
jgi:DNA-binding NarL/FixJ family response regulator